MAPKIDILGTGLLDERDSAYPQAVQLPNGDILCSFCVGGGPRASQGSDWARSKDGGNTWRLEGTILPAEKNTSLKNHLKLSLSADNKTIYAFGSRHRRAQGQVFGEYFSEPIFCASTDEGLTWSAPQVVPLPREGNFEIAHGILPLASGGLLAPAATLPAQDRLGEKVIAGISHNGGKTWPENALVFYDPEKRYGYFEHKFAEIAAGIVMAVCWTVTLGSVEDKPNSFAISKDDGATWGSPVSTGINGQTMTPIPLGLDRLLILYNRRYGAQGIVMALVTFSERKWKVHFEGLLYDAGKSRPKSLNPKKGAEELKSFEFGFPTAIKLFGGTILATHWCKEKGRFAIRWTKLCIHW